MYRCYLCCVRRRIYIVAISLPRWVTHFTSTNKMICPCERRDALQLGFTPPRTQLTFSITPCLVTGIKFLSFGHTHTLAAPLPFWSVFQAVCKFWAQFLLQSFAYFRLRFVVSSPLRNYVLMRRARQKSSRNKITSPIWFPFQRDSIAKTHQYSLVLTH